MPRFLIDANLPRYLPIWDGPDYVFVHDIDASLTDSEIWRHANDFGLTIVTRDADFSDRALVLRSGPHIVHIRLGNMRLRELSSALSSVWREVCELSTRCRLVQVFRDRVEILD